MPDRKTWKWSKPALEVYPSGYSHKAPRPGRKPWPARLHKRIRRCWSSFPEVELRCGERIIYEPVSDQDSIIAAVNDLIQRFRKKDWTPNSHAIMKQLGWTSSKWNAFTRENEDKLIWDYVPRPHWSESDDTSNQRTMARIEERGIPPDKIAFKMEAARKVMYKDLRAMGLTHAEVKAAMAMEKYGENHFAESMQMISSNVLTGAMKLNTQKKCIEGRLIIVRKCIDEYGPIMCDERTAWIREENRCIRQYIEICRLLNEIQDTWYQGSAQLALVKMRMRAQENGKPGSNDQKMAKPSFRPTIIDAQEVPQDITPTELEPEPQSPPPHDQSPDQGGDEAAAS